MTNQEIAIKKIEDKFKKELKEYLTPEKSFLFSTEMVASKYSECDALQFALDTLGVDTHSIINSVRAEVGLPELSA